MQGVREQLYSGTQDNTKTGTPGCDQSSFNMALNSAYPAATEKKKIPSKYDVSEGTFRPNIFRTISVCGTVDLFSHSLMPCVNNTIEPIFKWSE